MNEKRDPLHEPKPGDVILKNTPKSSLQRTVLGFADNYVTYRDKRGRENRCWITSWWEWCRGAEVYHKA